MISSPTYIGNAIYYDENYAFIDRKKKTCRMTKPIYIGIAILELSKHLMYNFHYNVMKKKYGDKTTLMYMDTDSFIYHTYTDDIYEDMKEDKELYDFSEYSKDHKCYDETNKKVIGKMKDETKGNLVRVFIALRSKMYSLIIDNRTLTQNNKPEEKKTAKGVKRYVCKSLRHNQYNEILLTGGQLKHKQNGIISNKHIVTSQTVNKVSLSGYDDKKYILDDAINCLSYGHYKC